MIARVAPVVLVCLALLGLALGAAGPARADGAFDLSLELQSWRVVHEGEATIEFTWSVRNKGTVNATGDLVVGSSLPGQGTLVRPPCGVPADTHLSYCGSYTLSPGSSVTVVTFGVARLDEYVVFQAHVTSTGDVNSLDNDVSFVLNGPSVRPSSPVAPSCNAPLRMTLPFGPIDLPIADIVGRPRMYLNVTDGLVLDDDGHLRGTLPPTGGSLTVQFADGRCPSYVAVTILARPPVIEGAECDLARPTAAIAEGGRQPLASTRATLNQIVRSTPASPAGQTLLPAERVPLTLTVSIDGIRRTVSGATYVRVRVGAIRVNVVFPGPGCIGNGRNHSRGAAALSAFAKGCPIPEAGAKERLVRGTATITAYPYWDLDLSGGSPSWAKRPLLTPVIALTARCAP